jgi:hypothetical protein
MGNSVTSPDGVIRPILLIFVSVNQRLPSDPEVMPSGLLLTVIPAENSVIVGDDAWAFKGFAIARTERRVDAMTKPMSVILPVAEPLIG